MKKYAAIILTAVVVFTMTFALSACKKDEPVDEVITKVVTNEAGEAVTDENGNVVTEVADAVDGSDDADEATTATTDSGKSTSEAEKSSKNTTAKKGEKTSKANGKTTAKKTTKKQTTTKKETTTKPKRRKVSVTINIPYYEDEVHEMTVWYKVLGKDKEYTALKPQDVKFSNSSIDVELGKLKGDVRVVVKFDGIDNISNNMVTIKSDKSHGEISIVTGIERLEAMD